MIGIESINAYCARTSISIKDLFEYRELPTNRFTNLLINHKSVALPCEDSVSNAVNAAKPLINKMEKSEPDNIDMLITASESGVDFGKSISTYVHHYLGLNRNCRLFEIKQACYGGTAALQMAFAYLAGTPNAQRVLVIASDIARSSKDMPFAEPTQGSGAVAIMVSREAKIFFPDIGASGFYSYEVMDTCRPSPDIETGDSDISVLSYLDCLAGAFKDYQNKVHDADFQSSFDYLLFHTPFGGLVKGAHRKMLRSLKQHDPEEIDLDFANRVLPGLTHCMEVGNVYSATVFLSLLSLVSETSHDSPKRVGIFAYGSGCSSEFFSGVLLNSEQTRKWGQALRDTLGQRMILSIEEYDGINKESAKYSFGMKNHQVNTDTWQQIHDTAFNNSGLLTLSEVKDYHRIYVWN